jgi:glycosyltransferase involved in cell wall biosynthesis
VHNAVDVRTWPYHERKGDYVLFLGRFHPHKAPHLALEAAHAAGLPLVLAGKCAEPLEKEYFAREIEPRLAPDDTVFGVADATDKRHLLAGARCLLFPVQWEEPFGMVMIEAMACGTPVVALRAGAVPEVVADGLTGIICDRPDQLADAVRHAGTISPAACRAHVALRFNPANLGFGYEQAYRRAIGDHVRTGPVLSRPPAAVVPHRPRRPGPVRGTLGPPSAVESPTMAYGVPSPLRVRKGPSPTR